MILNQVGKRIIWCIIRTNIKIATLLASWRVARDDKNVNYMKIGVDAAILATKTNKTGNYQLTCNLLRALSKIDKKNQYFLYSFSPLPKKIISGYPKNFQSLVLRPKKFWMQVRLSIEQVSSPIGIFIGLNQALPYLTLSRSVVFVLDLAFEFYPQLFTNASKLSWQTRQATRKASKIIAISNSTKRDLIKFYQVEPSKIKVVYPGV